MIKNILTAAGIPFRKDRFQAPRSGSYAVYLEDVTADGPDGYNCIYTHDITIELYEPKPDDKAEVAIEAAIDAAGLHWSKQSRYWLQEEQRYQVIYEFTYYTKRRV